MQGSEQILEVLKELLKWNVVTSYGQVKDTLGLALAKPGDRLIYHLSDGTRTGVNISEESGANPAIISTLQSKWTKMGLMRKDQKGYCKQFYLEDFDLEIPEAAALKAAKATKRKDNKS
jgi:hypothetical protein